MRTVTEAEVKLKNLAQAKAAVFHVVETGEGLFQSIAEYCRTPLCHIICFAWNREHNLKRLTFYFRIAAGVVARNRCSAEIAQEWF